MKAIVHTKYGPPDELQLKEVEKPVPGTKFGGHADYCLVPQNRALIIKPGAMSWVEAVSISFAGGVSKETAENQLIY